MQVQFPTQPMDPEQCKPPANDAIRQLQEERGRRMNESHARGREWVRQCEQRYSASSDVYNCRKQGDHIGRQYGEYVRQQEENVRLVEAARRRCEGVARENQRIVEQQKEREAQMRQQQRQQEQRQQQAENERSRQENERRANEERNRREYEARQRQAHAEQLEEQRRQQERNQPRVIAQTNPGYYDNRNAPQAVQTPQMREAQLQERQAAAQRQRQQEAQALSDAARNLGDAIGGNTRRADPSGLMRNSAGVAETNVAINAGRGGSPVAGAIGSTSLAEAGARGAGAISSLDQSLAGVSNNNINDGARGGGSSTQYTPRTPPAAPRAVPPEQPAQVVASAPASPETACGRRVLFALNQCMARECEKPQFKGHPQCKAFEPVVSRD